MPSRISDAPSGGSSGPARNSRKRPRRSAAIARSYVIPDSDDDSIAEGGRDVITSDFAKTRRCETNLQRWIKHLSLLLKEEQRKVCDYADVLEAPLVHAFMMWQAKEKRKREQATAEPGTKIRVLRVSRYSTPCGSPL